MKDQDVFTGTHYPIPADLQAAMDFLGYKQGDFPVREQMVSQILTLPMYAKLADSEIKYVADSIITFLKNNK